jgi:hypothetical protein
VYDRTGRRVGQVHDLRFTAGGRPVTDSGRPPYRLTQIECGPAGIAHRFGFGHRAITGPWPFNRILARMARRSLVVNWDQIAAIGPERIELSAVVDELRSLGDGDD